MNNKELIEKLRAGTATPEEVDQLGGLLMGMMEDLREKDPKAYATFLQQVTLSLNAFSRKLEE